MEEAAERNEFVTSLLEAYLPVTILLFIINWLYFALKVIGGSGCAEPRSRGVNWLVVSFGCSVTVGVVCLASLVDSPVASARRFFLVH